MKKICFKCNEEKSLDMFYKHNKMADGHLNKCKECSKKDTTLNRNNNIEKYREYDRKRGSRRSTKDNRLYRAKFPRKYSAHIAVNNAIRSGVLIPQNCENCGASNNIHAHHDDYLKQLDIRWMCSPCHSQWHAKNGEAKNG